MSVEHFADGANNNARSIRDWDPIDKTIYSQIRPQAAAQHLDVVYGIVLPPGFLSFKADAIQVQHKTIPPASVRVVEVVDSNGGSITTGFPAASTATAKSLYTVPNTALTSGTFTPQTIIYVRVRGEGDPPGVAFIGTVTLNVNT